MDLYGSPSSSHFISPLPFATFPLSSPPHSIPFHFFLSSKLISDFPVVPYLVLDFIGRGLQNNTKRLKITNQRPGSLVIVEKGWEDDWVERVPLNVTQFSEMFLEPSWVA